MQHCFIGFAVILACSFLETSSVPVQVELTTPSVLNKRASESDDTRQSKDNRLFYDNPTEKNEEMVTVKEILEKIKSVNNALGKPNKLLDDKNILVPADSSVEDDNSAVDPEISDKTSNLFMKTKLQPFLLKNEDVDNFISEGNDDERQENSRALNYYREYPQNFLMQNQPMGINPVQMPYVINLPVLALPYQNYMYGGNSINNDFLGNNFDMNPVLSAKQKQSSMFNIPFLPNLPSFSFPSPLAPFFPILIKDPLVGLMQGGGFNNFVEYGQQADVCSRKQKTVNINSEDSAQDIIHIKDISSKFNNVRKSRAIKKRSNINQPSIQTQITSKKIRKVYVTKPPVTRAPIKQIYTEEDKQTIKNDSEDNLRFPNLFGDFNPFGSKKPIIPPGFFINRLRVRKGGVAIAGPGGVATAGQGGTAIVGPGGFAFTKPGSLAVAGPSAQIYALSNDADLNSVVSQIQTNTASGRSVVDSIPEGKLVATGPIVFYHPYNLSKPSH